MYRLHIGFMDEILATVRLHEESKKWLKLVKRILEASKNQKKIPEIEIDTRNPNKIFGACEKVFRSSQKLHLPLR